MDSQEIVLKKLEEQSAQIAELTVRVKKIQRYFLWMMIAGLLAILLPLIPLLFIIPSFIQTYQSVGAF